MDVIELTRRFVDIPSVTENEESLGLCLLDVLNQLAEEFGGVIEIMEVSPGRFNVFAQWGDLPTVTFSTHIDTVPPFFPSREDAEFVYGRGSCDAKGILAAMLVALRELLGEGARGLGILAVVGEERGSAGALAAGKLSRGARFLVNGEPTENRLGVGSKGALRLELKAHGRMAHSAYPELGESAIDKLILALHRLSQIDLPADPALGKSTMNVGTIQGGRAPNVIADEAAAEILIRLVDDGESTRREVERAVSGLAEVSEVLCIPAQHFDSVPGFPTTSVAYTTDIPALGPNWGKPFLLGPGSIHVAHTDAERMPKSQLVEAVALYKRLARHLIDSYPSIA